MILGDTSFTRMIHFNSLQWIDRGLKQIVGFGEGWGRREIGTKIGEGRREKMRRGRWEGRRGLTCSFLGRPILSRGGLYYHFEGSTGARNKGKEADIQERL